MTSNLGAGKARRGLGFTAGAPEADTDRMVAAAKSAFLPEFVNRIDEIVTFQALTPSRSSRSPGSSSARIAARLRAERGIELDGRGPSWSPGSRATGSTSSSAPGPCTATCGARWRRS